MPRPQLDPPAIGLPQIAAGVALGVALVRVVETFVSGLLMGLVGAALDRATVDSITAQVGDGVLFVGAFLTAAVTLALLAVLLAPLLLRSRR